MAEKVFKKDDIIFRQGDEAKAFYKVLDGSVGIFANYDGSEDVKLAEIKKGEFFGEMAVIDAAPRTGTARVLENGTRVLEISTLELNDYFAEDPDSISGLMIVLSSRLRGLTKEYDHVKEVAAKLHLDDQDQDDDFLLDLKKYNYYYKVRPGSTAKPSAEILREEAANKKHSDGFAKNVVSYRKGTVICREGDLVDCMYDIHWGRVGIYSNFGTPDQVELTVLGADNFFGEMGMISGQPRSATAVALDDNTTVEIIYPQDFRELFEKNPLKVDMILKHLSNRLRVLTRQYLEECEKIVKSTGALV